MINIIYCNYIYIYTRSQEERDKCMQCLLCIEKFDIQTLLIAGR